MKRAARLGAPADITRDNLVGILCPGTLIVVVVQLILRVLQKNLLGHIFPCPAGFPSASFCIRIWLKATLVSRRSQSALGLQLEVSYREPQMATFPSRTLHRGATQARSMALCTVAKGPEACRMDQRRSSSPMK